MRVENKIAGLHAESEGFRKDRYAYAVDVREQATKICDEAAAYLDRIAGRYEHASRRQLSEERRQHPVPDSPPYGRIRGDRL